MKAELEILGLDVSRHVVDTYAGFFDALGITRSKDLLRRRSKAELLVAGVKVATQTPPIRSGRRVIFLTLDDATGPVDATFFEDVQGPYAATVFHSWLLVVRGELRRTGSAGGLSPRDRRVGAAGALRAVAGRGSGRGTRVDGRGPRGLHRGRGGGRDPGVRREPLHPPGDGAGARRKHGRRHGQAAGTGALQRVPDVALLRHQAGRRGDQGRRPQAVAPQPGEPRMSCCAGPRQAPLGLRHVRATERASQRRPYRRGVGGPACRFSTEPLVTSSTSAVAPADSRSGSPSSGIGSGSSTPAPTPWRPWTAGPARRGVADQVVGQQGDLSSLLDVTEPGSTDLVLCHGVLEVVDDPAAALTTIAEVLRPGGVLSLLVAQRHAAVVARAMAGHFQQARAMLEPVADTGRSGRRFTRDEVTDLLAAGRSPAHRRARGQGLLRPGPRLPARPRARRHPAPWSSSSTPSPNAPSTSRSPPNYISSPSADAEPPCPGCPPTAAPADGPVRAGSRGGVSSS